MSELPPAPVAKRPVRIGRLIGGIVLCVVALGFVLTGVGLSVATTWLAKRNPVAEDVAPGSVTFDATKGQRYVVALGTSEESWSDLELSRTERREKFRIYDGDVASARCSIDHPSGSDDEVRGDRQGTATTLGSLYATVGSFEGRDGKTTVECSFSSPTETRFDLEDGVDAVDVERRAPFMVHERNGLLTVLGFVLIGGGVLVAGLGVLQILRATVWRGPRVT